MIGLQATSGMIPQLSQEIERLNYLQTLNPEVIPIIEQSKQNQQDFNLPNFALGGLSVGTIALIGLGAYLLFKKK